MLNCRLQTIVASFESVCYLIELGQLLKSHKRRKSESDSGHDQTKYLLSYQSIQTLPTKGQLDHVWDVNVDYIVLEIMFVVLNRFIRRRRRNHNFTIYFNYFEDLCSYACNYWKDQIQINFFYHATICRKFNNFNYVKFLLSASLLLKNEFIELDFPTHEKTRTSYSLLINKLKAYHLNNILARTSEIHGFYHLG